MENEALTMAVPETDTQNQIVVYQPNGVMKIDVRFDGETVWLLQSQIAELFSCSLENVRLHLKTYTHVANWRRRQLPRNPWKFEKRAAEMLRANSSIIIWTPSYL